MENSIAEIREWNEKYGPQQVGIKAAVDALLTEIDRLTTLCDGYRGEVAELHAQLDEKRDVNEELVATSTQFLDRAIKAESALTRARAEGIAEAAVKVYELKATLEDLSMHSPLALADNAYARAAYEATLTAAAIRSAAKGGPSCICGHDGKLTSDDCPRHGIGGNSEG